MVKRLIKTLLFERGELYVCVNGRRLLLAYCDPKIEVYEHRQSITAIGMNGYQVKSYHVAITLCENMDFTRDAEIAFLETVTDFELVADIQRSDGIFEQMVFKRLTPEEINLGETWKFEVSGQLELIKKLLAL